MTFAEHVMNDADVANGTPLRRVLLRETGRCAASAARAARRARGRSRLGAPYWMLREFIGLLARPLDSAELTRLTFDTPCGPLVVWLRKNQSDLYIAREILCERMYELDLPPGEPTVFETIIDLGANAGLSAAYLSRRYHAKTIVAVEPVHENVAVLRVNAAGVPARWIIEEAAIAAREGELEFFVSGVWSSCTAVESVGRVRHSAANRLEPLLERPRVTVPAVTIPTLIEKHGIDTVDLMKIDIEGGEFDLLTAESAWLERVRRVVIEIHDKYIDGDAVRSALLGHGFDSVPQHGPCELYVRAS